jgi:hypothetical protein
MTDARSDDALAQFLRDQGIDVVQVRDILEKDERPLPVGSDSGQTVASRPFVLACRENYPHPPLPAGIYFGLPEEVYHATPALSNTGIKRLASSPMLFHQTCPWLNEDYEEPETKSHFDLGHAVECRILEGREAYLGRVAVTLDKKDYPDALVTMKDIKARVEELGLKPRGTSKEQVFEQLMEWEPDAQLWDRLVAAHEADNEGKLFIGAKEARRIEIAARLTQLDDEQRAAITGGYPQISFFWNCAKTEVPMKARADYLKIRAIVDAKTMINQQERSFEGAIYREIANRHYNVQVSTYLEGAAEVRKLVRAHGESVIFTPDEMREADRAERVAWALKWASSNAPDEWLFLFIQTGLATATRLVRYPRGGTTKAVTDEIVSRMKRRFRQMNDTYSCDPWLDLAPMIELADEDLPGWTTEI